ncbi:hypothetical protein F5051DRAFT_311994, partial [Lentinula edodes]
MGFWVPCQDLGFAGKTDTSSPFAHLIFYWEALTVLSALQWLISSPDYRGTAGRPFRFTFRSDSSNTVDMFNSLRVQPKYNPILIAIVDLLIDSHVDLRVVHISGSQNSIADALSRFYFNRVRELQPNITILQLETPCLALGEVK